ncbi:NAD-dependent epimerase/dehydratase [Microbispora amethystogenes]|uniref:NAD-dependent epimerase/dehydratase family protein n=1 Tax=Microbispora amethystogenes TaxID=1427754 RepID=UPI003406528E
MNRPGTALSTVPGGGPPLVAVLGASGLVGSAVTARLARLPVAVRAVSRRPAATGKAEGGAGGVEVLAADLTVPANLERAVAGASAVIHLVLHSGGWRGADEDPAASERVNVGVMRDLVGLLRSRSRRGPAPLVVFAGSASQAGPGSGTPIDGTVPDHPVTAYDLQKQAAEDLLKRATSEGVLRGVSLRLPTVFGPAPDGAADRGVVSAMARRALAGEPLTMWHDGAVARELLYVGDVADAFLAALDRPEALAGRHWPLGHGRGEPLGDVFRRIALLVAERTGRPPVPVMPVPPPASARPGDFDSVVIDSSAFRASTGWRPRVPLDEALRRTVAALDAPGLDTPALDTRLDTHGLDTHGLDTHGTRSRES